MLLCRAPTPPRREHRSGASGYVREAGAEATGVQFIDVLPGGAPDFYGRVRQGAGADAICEQCGATGTAVEFKIDGVAQRMGGVRFWRTLDHVVIPQLHDHVLATAGFDASSAPQGWYPVSPAELTADETAHALMRVLRPPADFEAPPRWMAAPREVFEAHGLRLVLCRHCETARAEPSAA